MDADLLTYADEAGLPEGWGARLHGDTLRDLRADAPTLVETLQGKPDATRAGASRATT